MLSFLGKEFPRCYSSIKPIEYLQIAYRKAKLFGFNFKKSRTIFTKHNGFCNVIINNNYFSCVYNINRGADQLLPCVCYVLLQSENPYFFTDLHFLEEFLPEAYQTGIEGYIVTQFQIAGRFLKDMNIQLHLDSLEKKPEVKEPVAPSPLKEEHDSMPTIVSELAEIINLESQAQEELNKNLASGEPPKVKSLIHLYEKTTGNPPM